MGPITAINLEFVREVREEWSREASTLEAQAAPRARWSRRTTQVRTTIGKSLIAMGMWLSGRTAALTIDAADTTVSHQQ